MVVPAAPTVRVIRGAEGAGDHQSKQGLMNAVGVSTETCGSRGIWLGLITVPPGARAKAHLHEHHETALYVLQGEGEMWYGEDLREHVTCRAGDFMYIPAGVPHVPANPSATEPLVGLAARTDPNEQESVVLLPELDTALAQRLAARPA